MKGLCALVKANPDCLTFGTDLPSQRARLPILPSNIDVIRDTVDASLHCKVFFEMAVEFYRPQVVQTWNGY